MTLNELENMMVDILTKEQKERLLKAAKEVQVERSEQIGAIATASRLNKISRSVGDDSCWYEIFSDTIDYD